jgi:hypothetical protein
MTCHVYGGLPQGGRTAIVSMTRGQLLDDGNILGVLDDFDRLENWI